MANIRVILLEQAGLQAGAEKLRPWVRIVSCSPIQPVD
jgi:hypothetical protein